MFETLAQQTSRAVQAVSTPTTAILGALALGVFLGFLVLAFVVRLGTYTVAGLAAVVAVIAGAAIVGLLDKTQGGASGVSAYLIGLLVGGVLYVAAALLSYADVIFPRAAAS